MSPSNESIALFEAVADRSLAASALFDPAQQAAEVLKLEQLRIVPLDF